jgi:hypothetical protein
MFHLDKTFSKKAETLLYEHHLNLARLKEYYSGQKLVQEFVKERKRAVQRLRRLITRNAWS